MGAGHGHGPSHPDGRKIDKKISQEIEKTLEYQHSAHHKSIQVLILGLENSGKKTLMKQVRLLYGSGLDAEETKAYVAIVRRNVIESIQALLIDLKTLTSDLSTVVTSPDLVKQISAFDISDSKADIVQDQKSFETSSKLILTLWRDSLFQKTLHDHSPKFPSLSQSQYFLNQLDHITSTSYVPNENDILRVKESTLGLLEATVTISGTQFNFLCMRGSKGQRRKWLPSFGAGEESIAAVMFVASLDEYDQTHSNASREIIRDEILSIPSLDFLQPFAEIISDYLEEKEVSKLKDAIDFFGEICDNKFYEHVGLILLLNRRNIFNEKLKNVPLSKHFHDFHGSGSSDEAARYVETLFKEKNKHNTRKIYSFSTDAIDKSHVSTIMHDILQVFTAKTDSSSHHK